MSVDETKILLYHNTGVEHASKKYYLKNLRELQYNASFLALKMVLLSGKQDYDSKEEHLFFVFSTEAEFEK